MAQRSIPAPFLMKTFQLLDDPASDDVISWNESGTAFVVWKTVDFARDMLPNYFKHNNFSSFVRQLNTYGFRKTVPDKWEFANENFRRGEKELLSEIRRRKAMTSSPAHQAATAADQKSNGGDTAGSNNSGEELASTSTSSPNSKNPGSVDTAAADLSDENEKLKRDNESLSSELAQTKKQCDELAAFLMEYMKVGPDQISKIMRQGIIESSCDGGDRDRDHEISNDNDDKVVAREEEGLKLFGVWVKGKENEEDKKNGGGGGPQAKKRKMTEFHHAPPEERQGVQLSDGVSAYGNLVRPCALARIGYIRHVMETSN